MYIYIYIYTHTYRYNSIVDTSYIKVSYNIEQV